MRVHQAQRCRGNQLTNIDREEVLGEWTVTTDGERRQLFLGTKGLTLASPEEADRVGWSWDEIAQITFPTSFSMSIQTSTGPQVALGFASGARQREFRRSLQRQHPQADQDAAGVESRGGDRDTDRPGASGPTFQTESPRVVTTSVQRGPNQQTTMGYLMGPPEYLAVGIGLLVLGGSILGWGLGAEFTPLFIGGLIIAGVGQIVASIGVVAQGVRVGNRTRAGGGWIDR